MKWSGIVSKTFDIRDVDRIFIQQSYEDNWDLYISGLKGMAGAMWDYMVITASNERQAEAYRIQIEERSRNGWFPNKIKWMVVPDPDGQRVGSGGATLNVLSAIYRSIGSDIEEFKRLKILLIHSGGDSKRIPQYSATGKLFSPVPRELPDGRPSTLFDELFIGYCGLPCRMEGGVVIAAGDILILFNTMQTDLVGDGVVGLTMKAYASQGCNHGVFCADPAGDVRKFLHKVSLERLRSEGAVNALGNVNIDTGTFWLSSPAALSLISLVCDGQGNLDPVRLSEFVNDKVRLSFYSDFVMPMTGEASLEEYLAEPGECQGSGEREQCRNMIWEALRKHKLTVQRLSPARFIHFGTTHELREIMCSVGRVNNHLNWSNMVGSCSTRENATFINSEISRQAVIGKDCYIENSRVGGDSSLGTGAIISGCIFEKPVQVASESVWNMLPVTLDKTDGFVVRLYGIRDNPKEEAGRGGTLLGRDILQWMLQNGIEACDLWDGRGRSLWEAKLYPVCHTAIEAVLWAQALQNSILYGQSIDAEKWRSMPRMSLYDSFANADILRIMDSTRQVGDCAAAARFMEAVTTGACIDEAAGILGKGERALRRMKHILSLIRENKESSMGDRMRIYRALARVCELLDIDSAGIDAGTLENLCFREMNHAVSEAVLGGNTVMERYRIAKDHSEVSLPVRVNVGGEWSDTPPYSLECGGTVLNMAVTINGKMPVRARAERLKELVIRFRSVDQNIEAEFTSLDQLLQYDKPSEPFTLHKAVLVASGLLPRREKAGKMKLEAILDSLGGGIYLETSVSGIPKGSGLGTSSILAAAAIMAVRELLGILHDNQEVFDRVLLLEQLMSTGGGWQDQAGGVIPGIKLLTSRPGLRQIINAQKVDVTEKTMSDLDSRIVLIYTGQRRLAKSILRSIMSRYILNEEEAVAILSEIQKLSVLMKFELEKGDIEAFAQLMNVHREEITRLDAGSSNTCIDLIIKVAEPYLSGLMFCGAAGGGYMVGILKEASTREMLEASLCEVFHDTQVAVCSCKIYNG
jgi:fucokinase